MTADASVGAASMICAMRWLDELRCAPRPMPFGLAQKFSHLVPSRDPAMLYETESSAYWFGYAAVMQEFMAELAAAEVLPFVAKKGKK